MSARKYSKKFRIGVGDYGVEVFLENCIEDIPPGHVRIVEIGWIRKKRYLIANNGDRVVVVELTSGKVIYIPDLNSQIGGVNCG